MFQCAHSLCLRVCYQYTISSMTQLILLLHSNIITSTFLQVFQLHLIDCLLVNQPLDSIWITKAIVIPASSKFDINDKTMIENILYQFHYFLCIISSVISNNLPHDLFQSFPTIIGSACLGNELFLQLEVHVWAMSSSCIYCTTTLNKVGIS